MIELKLKLTPAPWFIEQGPTRGMLAIIGQHQRYVAFLEPPAPMGVKTLEEQTANAMLIAEAPLMYETIVGLVRRHTDAKRVAQELIASLKPIQEEGT